MTKKGFKQTEIGDLPTNWETKTIEELKAASPHALAMGPFGSNITKDNFLPRGVPVIRGNNLTSYRFTDENFVFVSNKKADELSSSTAVTGDVVITHRGTLGQVGIIPDHSKYPRYIVSQSGMKVTCNSKIVEPLFLFYYLKSERGQNSLLKNASQTGVPAIAQPLSSLRKVPIPFPPLPEQQSIAHILSTLDEKIELNRQMNETLEQIAQALFKRWFVDFEFPDEKTGKPYKSSGGKMVWNEELQKEVPKGWEVTCFDDIVTVRGGTTPDTKNPDYWAGDIAWITPKEITSSNKRHFSTVERYITQEGLENGPRELIPPQSILLTSRAPVGELGINEIPMATNQGFINITCKENTSKFFVWWWLRLNKKVLLAHANGTTFQEISKGSFRKIRLLAPPTRVMKEFDEAVLPLDKEIQTNENAADNLVKLRNALLPKLMSGEVRVKI